MCIYSLPDSVELTFFDGTLDGFLVIIKGLKLYSSKLDQLSHICLQTPFQVRKHKKSTNQLQTKKVRSSQRRTFRSALDYIQICKSIT